MIFVGRAKAPKGKTSKEGCMSVLIGTAITVAIIFLSALWLYWQWKLAKEGVLARARVIRKHRPLGRLMGPLSNVIEYDFLTPRGEFSRNSAFVGEAVCHVHEEGSEIEVVYLKNNPAINGTKYLVNKSREFMKLPPL
jgi:hypothetical protein